VGLDLILTALVADTGAGDVAKAAVVDGYTELRFAFRRRLAGRVRGQRVLGAALDDAGVWRTKLAAELAESGAADAKAIGEAARRMLAMADPSGAPEEKYRIDARRVVGLQVGDHNTQHDTFG